MSQKRTLDLPRDHTNPSAHIEELACLEIVCSSHDLCSIVAGKYRGSITIKWLSFLNCYRRVCEQESRRVTMGKLKITPSASDLPPDAIRCSGHHELLRHVQYCHVFVVDFQAVSFVHLTHIALFTCSFCCPNPHHKASNIAPTMKHASMRTILEQGYTHSLYDTSVCSHCTHPNLPLTTVVRSPSS